MIKGGWNMANEIEMINVSGTDYEVADATARENINSLDERVNIVESLCDTFATESELSAVRQDLERSFRNGVDLIAEACKDRGSTPAGQYPYTPQAVADAIKAIPSGGGGTPYSMFPQEVLGFTYGEVGSCDFHDHISDNDNVVVAHIIPTTDDSSIAMNFSIQLSSYYSGTITFSIIIDNKTTISNVASAVMEEGDGAVVSFSYTFSPSLTPEYHVITLKANMTKGFYQVDITCPLCNLYGYNFIAVVNVGDYLINGAFSNYYIPSNFINPSNPITYELDHGTGCGFPLEDIVNAMNNHYVSQFDTGTCFYMKGIDAYEEYNEETGEYNMVIPDILDVFTFNDGKFRYNHSTARSNDGIYEHHYFL
jgi:hypothetical protein